MKRSDDRILTTHVGSLARPEPLLDLMMEREHGRPYDEDAFEWAVASAVRDRVARQLDAGIDVVTDGEQGKASFLTYVSERLSGFEVTAGEPLLPASWQKEIADFPQYYRGYLGQDRPQVTPVQSMVAIGPVSYVGHDAVQADIANLRAALESAPEVEAFLPSTSPSGFGRNEFYASESEYLWAVAEAMQVEYTAIVEGGFLLQIDDPWLIEILTDDGVTEPAARARRAHEHIEALNHALRDLPRDRVRLHTCYGLNHGPRLGDLPLREIAPYMLRIDAGAYSFEVANPRHQHEWRIWQDLALPEGAVLLPGMLGHANNYVEHPELIADMICTYASLVGRENVIASSDCGFSSRATFHPEVHPTVVWAKLRALSEGAALATQRLWS